MNEQIMYRLCKCSSVNLLHIDEKMLDSRKVDGFLVHLPSGPLLWMTIFLCLRIG